MGAHQGGGRPVASGRSRIVGLTVTYEDGSTDSWTGTGSRSVERTPTTARSAPVLRDDDVTYVEAILRFDRASQARAAEAALLGGDDA